MRRGRPLHGACRIGAPLSMQESGVASVHHAGSIRPAAGMMRRTSASLQFHFSNGSSMQRTLPAMSSNL